MRMYMTAWVTLAAMVMYVWVFYNVGLARKKFGINAPCCEGPTGFQSVLRVQANTVEQMMVFYPALWMCAAFFSDFWAAIGGLIWVVGRVVYALGYYKEPGKRSLGFGISSLGTLALMACTVWGLIVR